MIQFLNNVLCLFVLLISLKQKKFRYTIIALLTLMYFAFSYLQGDVDIYDNTQVYGLLQRLTLIALAVYSIAAAKKSVDKKLDISAAVLSCIACVFRLIRTYLFRSYTVNIKMDAAAMRMIIDKYTRYYVPIDSVIKISLLTMLFCIAWRLGKPKPTDS